jgi:hypothetical protein
MEGSGLGFAAFTVPPVEAVRIAEVDSVGS